MLASYPQADARLIDEQAEGEMRAVIELVSRVRNIRTELSVKPGEYLPRLFVGTPDSDMRYVFANGAEQIARLTRASKIYVADRLERFAAGANGGANPDGVNIPRASARAVLAGGAEVAVPLEGLIDFAVERERLRKEEDKLAKEAERLRGQLANENFVARAPAEKVAELRQRMADIEQRTGALRQSMEAFAE
jgi:valyl-tRNA synthetase